MASERVTQEKLDEYRKEMETATAIVEGLSKSCETVEDLIGIMKLSTANDGQLKLILNSFLAANKQR